MNEPAAQLLTANDPQPPPDTIVRDDTGVEWQRSGDGGVAPWEPVEGGEHESWMKIAGNYGPVLVLEWGDEICPVHDVPEKDGVCSSCLADSAASGR